MKADWAFSLPVRLRGSHEMKVCSTEQTPHEHAKRNTANKRSTAHTAAHRGTAQHRTLTYRHATHASHSNNKDTRVPTAPRLPVMSATKSSSFIMIVQSAVPV